MAYPVDRFNGTPLTSVDDGTIDSTTDLRFIGKNYAGYGEIQNENFLHLLESFSNTTPPPKAISGQIWYDSGNSKLKFYSPGYNSSGSQPGWKPTGSVAVGISAPSGLQAGDFWFETSAEQLYAWNGSEYVLIGPEISADLAGTGIEVQIIEDTEGVTHSLTLLKSSSTIIATISKDAFTIKTSGIGDSSREAVLRNGGFDIIKKGFTLVNTPASGVTIDDHYYWGTTSNSLKLGGYPVTEFIRQSVPNLPANSRFPDSGYTVGDQNDLKVSIVNGDEPVIENQLGLPIKIRITLAGNVQRDIAVFTATAILPGTENFYNIGATNNKWANVYATSLFGNVTGNVVGNSVGVHTGNILASDTSIAYNAVDKTFFGNVQGNLTGTVFGNVTGTASNATTLNNQIGRQDAVPSTIALRDASANLTAVRFIGIADTANRLKIDNAASDADPNYKSAKTTASANTIAARDSGGNLLAVLFDGTATAARYADLAEKYLPDADYTVGTVVKVGGTAEVTATIWGDRAIGVVSANPAFMMNKDLEGGIYIALKGRVPVKVKGPVRKGDRLVASDGGVAISAGSAKMDTFAIALESSDEQSIKLIEAVVL